MDPSNIGFYSIKAAVLFQEGRFEDCIQLCEKAIGVSRSNSASSEEISKLIACIGQVHMKRGEYSKAVDHFEQSLKEYPTDLMAKELAKCKEKLKDFGFEPLVEVRDSPVHGRGVFALRDIKKSEIVCFYDGEVKTFAEILSDYNKNKVNKEYWMSHPTKPDSVLCGYPNPLNKFGVGQLINDSTMLNIKEMDFKKGIKDCEDYTIASKRLQNVTFLNTDFQMCATKDIKQGEELFLHYGYKMWLQELSESLDDEQYMLKLLYWTLDGQCTLRTKDGGWINLKVEDIYDLGENESKVFIEGYLHMPPENVELYMRKIPGFRFLLHYFLWLIDLDYVETTILDQETCNTPHLPY